MIQRKNRWQLASWNEEQNQLALQLSEQLSIPNLVTKLMIQRGYNTAQSINEFLHSSVEQLHDPFLLSDMDKAVHRINQAIELKEHVRIYGDYDADGVSSTALLFEVFSELGMNVDYYIPHRMLEGYGLNNGAIDKAHKANIDLIVTVDTGISSYEQVEYAKELGIDMIITDHHEPPDQLPDAIAVVNPKQEHCQYPFKGLAGVGVAFKLASALLGKPPLKWTSIVSLGTIADLMPLLDENRVLVKYGLQELQKGEQIGFNALMDVCNIEYNELSASNIGFALAPRINAAGRLEHAKQAVELITARNEQMAQALSMQLDYLNKDRQHIVELMVEEADEQWQQKLDQSQKEQREAPSVIVLSKVGWNVGVIGIVASKLLERYYKPVVIFGIDADTQIAKGSARSIEGFDVHAALTKCEEWLLHYGGHQAAAGMSLHEYNVAALEQALSQLAKEWVSTEEWIPKIKVDVECGLSEVSLQTISQLSLLEPFGMANPSPRVLIRDSSLKDKRAIGKDSKHLKLQLQAGQHGLDVIGFGMGHHISKLEFNSPIEVVGGLSINEWNQVKKPQLQLQDLHIRSVEERVFPSREQFVIIYQYIRKQGSVVKQGIYFQLKEVSGLSEANITLVLEVFEELKFIEILSHSIQAAASPDKRDLTSSERYNRAKLQFEMQ